MSFRSNHDAALARAEALEAELARERRRVADARRERDELRAELVAARTRRSSAPVPVAPPEPRTPPVSEVEVEQMGSPEWEMVSIVSIMVVLFSLVVLIASAR